MIVFELECREGGHRFEGWFGSSDDFARQQERGLLCCPMCGSADVGKALMAPRLARKGNQKGDAAPTPARASQPVAVPPAPMPPQMVAMMRAAAAMQAEALKSSTWVGDKFTDEARAMHYGDKDHAAIHGQATGEEVKALIEEGVEIAPVLFPVAPPDEIN
ncbi:MAG: DUF1178 family protein [Sphingomonadales bacterium]|nr:DUF1178 family protein [Sphingomonadales bacterium]